MADTPTLLRASLLVADVDRSLAFYARLGFRAQSDFTMPRDPRTDDLPLEAPSTGARIAVLASASGEGGRIGLVEFRDPAPGDNRKDPRLAGRGDAVLVFDVPDADAAHAALAAAGAATLGPPRVYASRLKAPDGGPMAGKVLRARDPDGHLVELIEAPKPVR